MHKKASDAADGTRLIAVSGVPLLLECFRRWARAHQMPVPVGVINTTHRRPVFVALMFSCGKHRDCAFVRVVPIADECARGVGCVNERIVIGWPLTTTHSVSFGFDCDHRVHKAVKLSERFRLGGLHHQGAGHREGHGGAHRV